MSEEIKVVKNEEVTEETKKGFGSKVKDGFKKHWKKGLAIAGIIGGALVGYALGQKADKSCEYSEETTEEDNDYELVEDAE